MTATTASTSVFNLDALCMLGVGMQRLDVALVLAYLGAMMVVGLVLSRRCKDTEQYFVASRSYKGWVLGVSMLSTTVSSITFLAFPAAAFALDWRMGVNNIMWPVGMVMAVLVFIPFFRRGFQTTAYEYLEKRYGPIASLYGAISYLISQLLRVGIVLYMVSLAISTLTGFDVKTVIIVTGVVICFYTVVGGIEGVIWTDVIQAFMLWIGGVVCLLLIVIKLPGGLGQVFEVGASNGKFFVGDMDFDLSRRTLWTMLMLGTWASIGNFCTSQDVAQRYMAAKSTHEARKGAVLSVFLSVPTWFFFLFIGTALWVYYHVNPSTLPEGIKSDQVLPHFMLTHFPTGLLGFVVAAVVAAAMSSLDSAINGVSTVMVTNVIRKHLAPGRPDAYYLRWAKGIGWITGTLMIVGALLFNMIPNKESVVNTQFIVFSLTGGCITAMFLLGFLTTRVHYRAAIVALSASVLFNIYLLFNTMGWLPTALRAPVHDYWVSMLVNFCFIIVAYLLGLVWRDNSKDLRGLTVWTADAGNNDGNAIETTEAIPVGSEA